MRKLIWGQIGKLLPEKADEYAQLHLNPWPELLEALRRHHLENYSIFQWGETVFSYFEYTGEDYDADMGRMASDPTMQRWWTYTKPCFERYAMSPKEEFYADMKQIFRLE